MKKDKNPSNERQGIYKTVTEGIAKFYIVTGDVKRMTPTNLEGPLTETRLKKVFESSGMPPDEIDALIANAECLGSL